MKTLIRTLLTCAIVWGGCDINVNVQQNPERCAEPDGLSLRDTLEWATGAADSGCFTPAQYDAVFRGIAARAPEGDCAWYVNIAYRTKIKRSPVAREMGQKAYECTAAEGKFNAPDFYLHEFGLDIDLAEHRALVIGGWRWEASCFTDWGDFTNRHPLTRDIALEVYQQAMGSLEYPLAMRCAESALLGTEFVEAAYTASLEAKR